MEEENYEKIYLIDRGKNNPFRGKVKE